MFWLALTCWIVLQCVVTLDWRRVRELVPAAMAGCVASGLYLVVGFDNVPAVLTDTGPLSGHIPILMLIQTIPAPLVAMWYAQGLTPGARLPVGRTLLFMGISLCQEWMGTAAGRIIHAAYWNPAYSVLYCFGGFLMIWRFQTWFTGAVPDARRTLSPE